MLVCKVFRKTESAEVYERRREEILAAAERGFVRSGFHRTTIQSIAADAGMSVGNVYRYFSSKAAVVEALVGREQAEMARDFDSLASDDLMSAFAALMRRQIVEAGRGEAVLWLEICAEASRNPAIAAVTQAHRQAILEHLTVFFSRVIEQRGLPSTVASPDATALAKLVITLITGLMVTQALNPEAAAVDSIDQLLAAVTAAVDGRIAPNETLLRVPA